jgi:hypothetical protein
MPYHTTDRDQFDYSIRLNLTGRTIFLKVFSDKPISSSFMYDFSTKEDLSVRRPKFLELDVGLNIERFADPPQK